MLSTSNYCNPSTFDYMSFYMMSNYGHEKQSGLPFIPTFGVSEDPFVSNQPSELYESNVNCQSCDYSTRCISSEICIRCNNCVLSITCTDCNGLYCSKGIVGYDSEKCINFLLSKINNYDIYYLLSTICEVTDTSFFNGTIEDAIVKAQSHMSWIESNPDEMNESDLKLLINFPHIVGLLIKIGFSLHLFPKQVVNKYYGYYGN